jgi:tetratricopeptide (TPR) repeat protein
MEQSLPEGKSRDGEKRQRKGSSMARDRKSKEELNDLIEEILVDAYGNDEQLWAFRQAFIDDIDIQALNLTPLALHEKGLWDPKKHYWGEPDEPMEPWTKPMIKWGVRPQYEMEQVLPGQDPDDPDTDPIVESVDLKEAGDYRGVRRILMNLLAADLRCLDAHAHLGSLVFDHDPETAIRHFDMGVKIGDLSLDKDFKGLLPWGYIDNRPFLRCLQGYGVCLWRLGRLREAEKVFTRMLWLNPTDNQGARFNLYSVKAGEVWQE